MLGIYVDSNELRAAMSYGDSDDVFTEEAMTRPLFEEPTPEIERMDASSGPHGFMIGPMGLIPSKQDIGLEFYDAANQLVEAIKQGRCEDYRLVNPVLYLYRHAIELFVKGLMNSSKHDHDLAKLARQLEAYARTKKVTVPAWVDARLREIARMDPGSTMFRYASNYDRDARRPAPVQTEVYVDIPHLQKAMRALVIALAGDYADLSDRRL
jgi:hypothetical protein